ncbi:hypothetical protein B0I35DRAFT_425871 [Stachybotrys elegans]|uniref:Rhodopsin domain-containing protein n=1 Tax=Stachybotrys elegans TaxID=80388 RepID=A0A8K0SZC7_9HYPO|nr:hypothetical protein B0I35DRAFT_425871 [Stachybotrys elegans]
MTDTAADLSNLIPPPTEIDNSNQVYSVPVACIVLGVITTILVLLRLGGRIWCKSFGTDDWVTLAALVLFVGWTVLAAYANLAGGVGKPLWEVTLGEWSIFWTTTLASTFLYPSVSGAIRISSVLFFQRLFAHGTKSKWFLWILLALQVVYIIVFSIISGFLCDPIREIQDPFEVLMFCDFDLFFNTRTSVYVLAIAFDLALAIFPMVIVYRLQMPAKKRITAAAIFLVGAVATVASIYKFALHIRSQQEVPHIDPKWFSYLMSRFVLPTSVSIGITFWIPCQIELSVALMGMSLPAIRQLYFQLRGRQQITTTPRNTADKPSVAGLSGRKSGPWSFSHLQDSDVELNQVA